MNLDALREAVARLDDSLLRGIWRAAMNGASDGWHVCTTGNSAIDGNDWAVYSEGLHTSEYDGDAKTDAEGIAELRMLLPQLRYALDMLAEQIQPQLGLEESS